MDEDGRPEGQSQLEGGDLETVESKASGTAKNALSRVLIPGVATNLVRISQEEACKSEIRGFQPWLHTSESPVDLLKTKTVTKTPPRVPWLCLQTVMLIGWVGPQKWHY